MIIDEDIYYKRHITFLLKVYIWIFCVYIGYMEIRPLPKLKEGQNAYLN